MSTGSVLDRGVLWLVAKAMLMMLTGFAHPVQAFIDPPYLTPEHPGAGEPVSVNIRFGICDSIGELPSAGYPRITRNGDELRIVFWSTTNLDPILCNVPVLTGTFELGTFPAGTYTVQVDRDYFGDLGGLLTETLGVLPFTVAAPTPAVPVPALGRLGLAILVVALVGLVAWRNRQASVPIVAALVLPMGVPAQVSDLSPSFHRVRGGAPDPWADGSTPSRPHSLNTAHPAQTRACAPSTCPR